MTNIRCLPDPGDSLKIVLYVFYIEMRFFAIPILMLLIITQTLGNWFVVMAFTANQGYISKNLCVNRYVPQMHCNGKCILMKKMKEKQNSEQGQPDGKVEVSTIVISSRNFYTNCLFSIPVTSVSVIADNRFQRPVDVSLSFFQPPRL